MTEESYTIHAEGLDEIINKMAAFPRTLEREVDDTMKASLVAMESSVPDYPPKPSSSKYVRTHQLARSLTIGASNMNIAKVEDLGNVKQAEFGTNLEYAPYVISDTMQAETHKGWWWTIQMVAKRAIPKIEKLFGKMADRLARFVDKGGRV